MNINAIINELANKFGTTAQYLIGEMQKYYIIENSISGFAFLLIVIISAVTIKKLVAKSTKMKTEEGEWSDWEAPLVWCILPGAFLLGCGIGFIVCIKDLLLWTFTPTASVLPEILKMVSR